MRWLWEGVGVQLQTFMNRKESPAGIVCELDSLGFVLEFVVTQLSLKLKIFSSVKMAASWVFMINAIAVILHVGYVSVRQKIRKNTCRVIVENCRS